ncbi:MAG: metallophosphoesterase [Planctomycetota bacterium]
MATWIVGDIHGCAEELQALLARLAPTPADRLVALGDLFHRGPDAAGVLDLLVAHRFLFLLGNHEERVLRRVRLAPDAPDGSDRPPRRTEFPPLVAGDLAGDGGRPLAAPPERYGEVLRFLQGHSGYFLRPAAIEGAGPTPDGRGWLVVHAGLSIERGPEGSTVEELVYPPRVRRRGRPLWFEAWEGPELAVFGHLPAPAPRRLHAGGHLVALGIDTGCVYGGALSAYSPERDEIVSVPAARVYAEL